MLQGKTKLPGSACYVKSGQAIRRLIKSIAEKSGF